MYKWIDLPYTARTPQSCTYLFAVGGYHSIDNGCPGWGSADLQEIHFIGDTMGELVITYADGEQDAVPLVFGYTMWFFSHWKDTTLPFKGEGADPELNALLRASLHLLGAYEGEMDCVLKIRVRSKPILRVEVVGNPAKNGEPRFTDAYLVNDEYDIVHNIQDDRQIRFDMEDPFFAAHTIDSTDPYPAAVKEALAAINHATMTYEEDFAAAPPFVPPADARGSRAAFSGNPLADIATGVIYHNVRNLIDRTKENGLCPESYYGAPSWRYDGFGAWRADANTYYTTVYSRSVAVFDMLYFGYPQTAQKAAEYVNKWMMYFPENHLTIQGKEIPGHYPVVVNNPFYYSKFLAPFGNWPTRFTKEKFGDEYQNMGNQETDGDGLRMIDNYLVWRSTGCSEEWLADNWKYISEGARWITWCFDNPDVSFARDDLLYAESEAGMNDYTMYCNVACYLGMLGYAEMARAAGRDSEAEQWQAVADRMHRGIEGLAGPAGDVWNASSFGFVHDPAVTMMALYYGFDTSDMDPVWVERSRRTYESDIQSVSKYGYFASSHGVGYNQAIMTQNALLLDRMADATRLMENISRICYAPRLPEPYLVPECFCVDVKAGVLRRQGDLGNLYQLADILKCYAITIGVSPVIDRTLKIMPRLPANWDLNVQNQSICGAAGTLDMSVRYPRYGVQEASICLGRVSDVDQAQFRAGPFPVDAVVESIRRNGVDTPYTAELSGDSRWFRIPLEICQEEQLITVVCK